MKATLRKRGPNPLWIVTAVLAAPIVALWIVARRPAVEVPAVVHVERSDTTERASDAPVVEPSPPVRIYARTGLVIGSSTTSYRPTVRLRPDRDATGKVHGWGSRGMSDTTSVVALEPTVRTATSRTLWALPVPPAKGYDLAGWTEFRCETDDVPVDARADAAWCGRWAWPFHPDGWIHVSVGEAPGLPTSSVLVLNADGTATLAAAPGVTRRWGVVDGVLYLKRFAAPSGRFGVVIGVREGDDVIRFAAQGEARRVR